MRRAKEFAGERAGGRRHWYGGEAERRGRWLARQQLWKIPSSSSETIRITNHETKCITPLQSTPANEPIFNVKGINRARDRSPTLHVVDGDEQGAKQKQTVICVSVDKK